MRDEAVVWRGEWVVCSTNRLLNEQNLNDACRRSSPRFGSDRIDLQAPRTSTKLPQLDLIATGFREMRTYSTRLKMGIWDLENGILLTNVFMK